METFHIKEKIGSSEYKFVSRIDAIRAKNIYDKKKNSLSQNGFEEFLDQEGIEFVYSQEEK